MTTWVSSEELVTFPLDEWEIVSPSGPYNGISYGAGTIVYDWSVVPNTDQTGNGISNFSMTQDEDGILTTAIALDVPDGSGEVSFNLSSTRGVHESIRWGAFIAGMTLTWRSASADFGAAGVDPDVLSYMTVAGSYYPWTGYGAFRLWYPDGLSGPLRFDFPGGFVDSTDPLGPSARFSMLTTSGGSFTMSPPAVFPLSNPPYPHQGHVAFTDLKFVAWNPDSITVPTSHLFLAQGGSWYPLTPYKAGTDSWQSTGPMSRL